jgi:hexokinase
LNVLVEAIINDGCATLLSQAYSDPSTRFGLILGTGTNVAMMVPVTALGGEKFAGRPGEWREQAKAVLVNTEYSMFGKDSIPRTRWDVALNDAHIRPDYQPIEYLISGRYLGEILRLVLVEAIMVAHLFGGELTDKALGSYTLDTRLLADIESYVLSF